MLSEWQLNPVAAWSGLKLDADCKQSIAIVARCVFGPIKQGVLQKVHGDLLYCLQPVTYIAVLCPPLPTHIHAERLVVYGYRQHPALAGLSAKVDKDFIAR